MSKVNLELKAALVRHFGSQAAAAKALGFSESRLSRLIRGWATARAEEMQIFARLFRNHKSK